MFRNSADASEVDCRLEAILREVSLEVFGSDDEVNQLDFETIERRSHEVGRRVARRLSEEAAATQAENAREAQPCPQCRRPCRGTIETRELITQDGPISLQEAEYTCPHCRRAFFPQPSSPTSESSPIQSGRPDPGGLHGGRDTLVSGSDQTSSDQHQSDDLAPASAKPRSGGRRRTRGKTT